MFKDMRLTDFAAKLASSAPTPGGGGASAYAGALGASLGAMAANLTLGKKKYASVQSDMERLCAEAESLRAELIELVDADAAAFEPLSRAYSLPKDAPDRAEIMERCLRSAAAVPMEILRLSCRCVELHRELEGKCSEMMMSDVGTGAALCRAALWGAGLNVRVNTALMADREYARKLNDEVSELTERYGEMAEDICKAVMGRYA